jgi:hypothetical protein
MTGVVLPCGLAGSPDLSLGNRSLAAIAWVAACVPASADGGGATGCCGITLQQHKALLDIIHFLDDGPGDGFLSGSAKVTSYPPGIPWPSSQIWYVDAGLTGRIFAIFYTRNMLQQATTVVYQMYAADGVTVDVTVTDAVTYVGVVEVLRVRTWS